MRQLHVLRFSPTVEGGLRPCAEGEGLGTSPEGIEKRSRSAIASNTCRARRFRGQGLSCGHPDPPPWFVFCQRGNAIHTVFTVQKFGYEIRQFSERHPLGRYWSSLLVSFSLLPFLNECRLSITRCLGLGFPFFGFAIFLRISFGKISGAEKTHLTGPDV